MNLVDPTLETRVDLLNSCFDDFDEKSSKPETSSGFTSSLSEINESGWVGGTRLLSGKSSDAISSGVGWMLEQSIYTNKLQ